MNFQPPEESVWEHTLPGTLDIVTERAHSKSYIQLLPETQKEAVTAGIKAIVTKGDGMQWEDKSRSVFLYPYKTTVVICKKI